MTHPAVAFSGRHGFTRDQLRAHIADPSVCPLGDTLYPSHEWQSVAFQPDGATYVCTACDLRALDMDEGHITLVPCEHGEQPGYCDCNWVAGQKIEEAA